MIELSQVADTIRSVSCVGVQFGALQAEDGKLTLTKSPDVSRDLPSESNTSLKSIKFHFGESRLIAWQLDKLLPFTRSEQLPYFTYVPDPLVQPVLHRLARDISGILGKQDSPELRDGIDNVLKTETTRDLLGELTSLSNTATNLWFRIFLTAIVKLIEDTLKKLNQDTESGAKPQYDEAALKQVLQNILDLDAIMDEKNPHIPATELNEASHFTVEHLDDPNRLVFKWDQTLGKDFLTALMGVASSYRISGNPHSANDRLAFHAGYYLLSQGQNPFDAYKSRTLGTVGFREPNCQTYLSLTDPGQGHVFGTTVREQWMKGAIVHVEHLERPAGTTQAQIESYRLPSIREFARVCLHTGYAAPNTCYVGRPLSDSGDFKYDFIKVVDTVSAACSSIFQLGAAECKIAMGHLKASDMVAYMRALRAHTLKNYRQCFSAAFNLNTPLVDDIHERYYKKPIEIGRRAVELAALGGFDKVTWDGASDSYPSTPLLKAEGTNDKGEQEKGLLTLRDAKELVHMAHSAGLITYFSAGFKPKHIKVAVYSGVDGIGLGGAQVLRSMDPVTKMHGEYQEFRIDELIKERDTAAATTHGKASLLLARLDQMYYEGSINESELDVREQLYANLNKERPDDALLADKLTGRIVGQVLALPDDKEEPWKARARRLLQQRSDKPSLLQAQGGPGNWENFSRVLNGILGSEAQHAKFSNGNISSAEGDIHSFFMSAEWQKRLKTYREWLAERDSEVKPLEQSRRPKYFPDEVNAYVKATPFGASQDLVISDLFKEVSA